MCVGWHADWLRRVSDAVLLCSCPCGSVGLASSVVYAGSTGSGAVRPRAKLRMHGNARPFPSCAGHRQCWSALQGARMRGADNHKDTWGQTTIAQAPSTGLKPWLCSQPSMSSEGLTVAQHIQHPVRQGLDVHRHRVQPPTGPVQVHNVSQVPAALAGDRLPCTASFRPACGAGAAEASASSVGACRTVCAAGQLLCAAGTGLGASEQWSSACAGRSPQSRPGAATQLLSRRGCAARPVTGLVQGAGYK